MSYGCNHKIISVMTLSELQPGPGAFLELQSLNSAKLVAQASHIHSLFINAVIKSRY